MDSVEGATADIYDALRDELARFAAAAGGRDAAGDLVKDSVRRVGSGHGPSEREGPRAELYRAIVQSARSARHASEVDRVPSPPVLGTSPEALALDPEARDALLSLRPQHRAVAYLVHWQGLSLEETARLLGCSRRAARRSLRLAVDRLGGIGARSEGDAETIRAVFDTLVEPAPETPDGQEVASFIAAAPPTERRLLSGSRRQPRAWLLAGAVVALLGVGGVTLLLEGGSDRADPLAGPSTSPTTIVTTTTPATPTTASPATTSLPPTTVEAIAPSPMTWERVEVDSLVEGEGMGRPAEYMGSMASGEDGLVAAGMTDMPVLTGDLDSVGWVAAFWHSDDGTAWERIPHDDALFGNADEFLQVRSVTAGGPGYVAVGYVIDREGYDLTPYAEYVKWQMGSEYIDGVVWLSEDGRSWTRVDPPGLAGPGWQMPNGVAPGGPGLVMVGFDEEVGSRLWTSADGRAWQAVEPDPFGEGANVWGVFSDSQGLLAVGNIDLQPVIWQSGDAVSWETHRLTPPGADIRGETQAAVRFGDTIIGVGFAAEDPEMGEHVAGIWVSKDRGATWEQVPPFTSTVRVTDLFGLLHTPDGLVASGMVYDWNDPDFRRGGVWVSVDDGTSWAPIPNQDGLFGDYAETGASISGGLVTVGDQVILPGFYAGEPAVWIGSWDR